MNYGNNSTVLFSNPSVSYYNLPSPGSQDIAVKQDSRQSATCCATPYGTIVHLSGASDVASSNATCCATPYGTIVHLSGTSDVASSNEDGTCCATPYGTIVHLTGSSQDASLAQMKM